MFCMLVNIHFQKRPKVATVCVLLTYDGPSSSEEWFAPYVHIIPKSVLRCFPNIEIQN